MKLYYKVINIIVEKGNEENMGARPLRNKLQDLVENPLADKLLEGSLQENMEAVASIKGDRLEYKFVEKKAGKKNKGTWPIVFRNYLQNTGGF